jgi:hypothetical protein
MRVADRTLAPKLVTKAAVSPRGAVMRFFLRGHARRTPGLREGMIERS